MRHLAKLVIPTIENLREKTIASLSQPGAFDMNSYETCMVGHILRAAGFAPIRSDSSSDPCLSGYVSQADRARLLWEAAYGAQEGKRLDFGSNWHCDWSKVTASDAARHLNGESPQQIQFTPR